MFATLEFSDYAIIAVIVIVFAGGATASMSKWLMRIEHKLDLIMTTLGLDYTPAAQGAWQALPPTRPKKSRRSKAYREEHGVGLAEAKRAVEDYITGASEGQPPAS